MVERILNLIKKKLYLLGNLKQDTDIQYLKRKILKLFQSTSVWFMDLLIACGILDVGIDT